MYNQYPFNSFYPGSIGSIAPSYTSNPTGLGGLLSGLGKKAFSWDGFLTNTQKTLNVINQALPIYNQVKPMFRNMGTVFRVIGELNKSNDVSTTNNSNNVNNTTNNNTIPSTSNINNPQFFV